MLPKHGDIQTMGQLGWVFQSAAVLPERCAVTTFSALDQGHLTVVTAHHALPKVMLCAQEPSVKHSMPSN